MFPGVPLYSPASNFEKRQAATCRFAKEFSANQKNISTNRKEEIKILKRLVHLPPGLPAIHKFLTVPLLLY